MAAWQSLVAVFELVRQLASETGGVPVADEITTKVRDLDYDVANQLADTANGLDRMHQVINSDYGRFPVAPPRTLEVAPLRVGCC